MSEAGEEPWTGLCISGTLPFSFRPDATPPAPDAIAAADAMNLQTLIVDASLGESRRGLEAAEPDANRQSDLERLESKVDVMLGMLARLATHDRPPGNPCPVRLFARGLEWHATGAVPRAGTCGAVLLQVNPAFAQLLTLPGTVAGDRRGEEGTWVRFRFEGVSQRVVELLERLIFRQHRRQVAGSHGPATPAG